MGTRIDQKTAMGTVGSLIATILTTVLAMGGVTDGWTADDVALLTGAAAVLLTGVMAFWVPNELSPQLAVDPKAFAATMGAAAATLLWFILARTVDEVAGWSAEQLANVIGLTATVLAFAFGWKIRNGASPIPGDGVVTIIDPDDLAAHDQILEGGDA
jgi:ABC-type uncharacterized transport system permease subunit